MTEISNEAGIIPAAPPRPPRRALRAFVRWTCAILAFAGTASGVGYAVTLPERAELPGLATADDGRWDYPEIKLPELPKAKQGPFAGDTNPGEVHHADLRTLLLPAPAGAKPDKAFPGRGGWLKAEDFVAAYEKKERKELRAQLRDDGVRQIAATGWAMPDGTRTQIYLLRFDTLGSASQFYDTAYSGLSGLPGRELQGAPKLEPDEGLQRAPWAGVHAYDEPQPRGKLHVRQAYVAAGDLMALVVQSRPGAAARVPFHQTVILQSQLLR